MSKSFKKFRNRWDDEDDYDTEKDRRLEDRRNKRREKDKDRFGKFEKDDEE
jgi:hypothetical protein